VHARECFIFSLDWRVRCCFAVSSHACVISHAWETCAITDDSLAKVYYEYIMYDYITPLVLRSYLNSVFQAGKSPFLILQNDPARKLACPLVWFAIRCAFHVLFLRNVASDYSLNMSMTNPSPKRWDMQNDRSAIVLFQKIMKRNFAKDASIFEEKGCFRCSVRLRIRSGSPSCPFKND